MEILLAPVHCIYHLLLDHHWMASQQKWALMSKQVIPGWQKRHVWKSHQTFNVVQCMSGEALIHAFPVILGIHIHSDHGRAVIFRSKLEGGTFLLRYERELLFTQRTIKVSHSFPRLCLHTFQVLGYDFLTIKLKRSHRESLSARRVLGWSISENHDLKKM